MLALVQIPLPGFKASRESASATCARLICFLVTAFTLFLVWTIPTSVGAATTTPATSGLPAASVDEPFPGNAPGFDSADSVSAGADGHSCLLKRSRTPIRARTPSLRELVRPALPDFLTATSCTRLLRAVANVSDLLSPFTAFDESPFCQTGVSYRLWLARHPGAP